MILLIPTFLKVFKFGKMVNKRLINWLTIIAINQINNILNID